MLHKLKNLLRYCQFNKSFKSQYFRKPSPYSHYKEVVCLCAFCHFDGAVGLNLSVLYLEDKYVTNSVFEPHNLDSFCKISCKLKCCKTGKMAPIDDFPACLCECLCQNNILKRKLTSVIFYHILVSLLYNPKVQICSSKCE